MYRGQPGLRQEVAGQVHLFKVLGEGLALDVASGSLHFVDEAAWEVIAAYCLGRAAILRQLGPRFGPRTVAEVWDEVNELVQCGLLFTQDPLPPALQATRPLKALCLNVAHDCDLACSYCFAGRGEFRGPRGLMTREVARSALHFLASNSGQVSSLEVDFFGGEPLLNFEVIRDTAEYAREFAKLTGKPFRFTVTTNGTHLTPDVMDFLSMQEFGVVLSLDGRKAVHDRHRRDRAGVGTYLRVVGPMLELTRRRPAHTYYVRGTYTHQNLDFVEDVKHMAELGFLSLSLEPVVAFPHEDYALRLEDMTAVENEYERLADLYLREALAGRRFTFFHFEVDLHAGPCLPKRLTGCGAGVEYLAVAADGSLYPCHQFVGNPDFLMGHVDQGIQRPELAQRFRDCHAMSKTPCRTCWARYHCGGGCHASAHLLNQDMDRPYQLGCILQKKRLECALYVQAKLSAANPASVTENPGEYARMGACEGE